MRFVSLVPSLTELLFLLGLDEQVVGITRFCVHPKKKIRGITRIGGTKTIKIDKTIDLTPDLVIANKEENSKNDIELLSQKCNVWVTEIINLNDVYAVILELGLRTKTAKKAQDLIANIKLGFYSLHNLLPELKVLYVIWNAPIMVAGHETFINSILKELHWINILPLEAIRYPVLSAEKVLELAPEYILLSSEPYPFKENHLVQYKNQFPNSNVILVDGEMFSWYGSRLLLAPSYFKTLINSML